MSQTSQARLDNPNSQPSCTSWCLCGGLARQRGNLSGIGPVTCFEGLMDIGLELLDSGMKFSDSWWLEQNWCNYHRNLAMCLIRYRQVDEVVDGLTSNRLLIIHADGCVEPGVKWLRVCANRQ